MSERETATGDLGLIQAFVNTVDLMPGHEELTDPNTLQAWLVARGLMDGSQRVDESDLKHAIALREAMRGVIGGNSGLKVYPVDLATLNQAATQSGLRMRFGPGGRPRLEPEAAGAVGALQRLVHDGVLRQPREGAAVQGQDEAVARLVATIARSRTRNGWIVATIARLRARNGWKSRLSRVFERGMGGQSRLSRGNWPAGG